MRDLKILFFVMLGIGFLSSWVVCDSSAEEIVTAYKAEQVVPIGAKRDREKNEQEIEAQEKKTRVMYDKKLGKIREMKEGKKDKHLEK